MTTPTLAAVRSYQLNLVNTQAGTGDGDRATAVTMRGVDSTGTAATLVQWTGQHRGTGADHAGQLTLAVNTGTAVTPTLTVSAAGAECAAVPHVPQMAINGLTLDRDSTDSLVVGRGAASLAATGTAATTFGCTAALEAPTGTLPYNGTD